MNANLEISVIIPVYNGGERFRQCLVALSNVLSPTHEVIVVADGDTDGSSQLAQHFGAKVLYTSRQKGPAHARNLGASIAQGKILFFLDADVMVRSDTLVQIIAAFQNEPDLAALIGSYDDAPGASNFLSQYKNLFNHYTHQTASEEASTFWGACGAIRRKIFLSMQGFNENYCRPCIEDIELGYRLKAKGYKIKLLKELQVKHLKQWEPLKLLKAEIFDRALPWTELILRDRTIVNDLNLQVSSRISILLTYSAIMAFLGSFWSLIFIAVTAAILMILLIINAPVYKFFWNKRGLLFTLKVLPWHWFYYFYSGLAFAIGLLLYGLQPKFWSRTMFIQTSN